MTRLNLEDIGIKNRKNIINNIILKGLIMAWFKRHKIKKHREKEITFLHEQDGEPERLFKNEIVRVFESIPEISNAYLVRVDFGNPDEYNVAICLNYSGSDNEMIAGLIQKVFQSICNVKAILDVMFLDKKHNIEIVKVAKPFYRKH